MCPEPVHPLENKLGMVPTPLLPVWRVALPGNQTKCRPLPHSLHPCFSKVDCRTSAMMGRVLLSPIRATRPNQHMQVEEDLLRLALPQLDHQSPHIPRQAAQLLQPEPARIENQALWRPAIVRRIILLAVRPRQELE